MLYWSQEAFVSALGGSLLHSLWQGAVLGVVGLVIRKRLLRSTPELRCGVFSLLQMTFFAVSIGTFLSLYAQGSQAIPSADRLITGPISVVVTAPSAGEGGASSLMHLLPTLTPMLVTVWALGVCALSLRHLGGLLLLHRLSRVGTVPGLPVWQTGTERLAVQMGIGRKIVLRFSAQIDVPCTFGLFKSYILMPASAMMGLTPDQAEALIAHELAHIARYDLFSNLVQVCIETVLFFHPVVWWISTQIREAREQRCDDLAVQIIGDPVLYARALYSLEEARSTFPQLALGAKGDHSKMTNRHLIHRIQRVLGVSSPERRDSWAKGVLALCTAAIGLAVLMPVRAYSRQTPQGPQAKPEKSVKAVHSIHIQMNINGNKIDLYAPDRKPDTIVKVNDTEKRFGDLPAELQQAINKAVHSGTNGVHYGNKPNIVLDPKSKPRILLLINGDKVELTADSNDFSTKDLKPNSRVMVNGKKERFGELTERQQQQIRNTKAGIHISTSVPTSDKANGAPSEVKSDVNVKKVIPPAPGPDKP